MRNSIPFIVFFMFGPTLACGSLEETKSTSKPAELSSFTIGSGDAFTNRSQVFLDIVASGATEMSIHNNLDCSGTRSWEAFVRLREWVFLHHNELNPISIVAKNADGNESSCVSGLVTHDAVAPLVATEFPKTADKTLLQDDMLVIAGNASDSGAGTAAVYLGIKHESGYYLDREKKGFTTQIPTFFLAELNGEDWSSGLPGKLFVPGTTYQIEASSEDAIKNESHSTQIGTFIWHSP